MLKIIFDEEYFCYSSNHQWTPLHYASWKGHFEVVKYLIEKGADVNCVWNFWIFKDRMNVFALFNNFNDPFYQRYDLRYKIKEPQINILIENGMI